MKKPAMLAFLLLMLSLGAQSLGPPIQDAATVTIIRKRSGIMNMAATYTVYAEGQELGKLKPGDSITLRMPSGATAFFFRSEALGRAEPEVEACLFELESGKTFYILITEKMNGFNVRPADENEARKLLEAE